MIDYTGIRCPVCQKEFVPEDDVVVCPECGSPHHRACYRETGHCIHQEKHGSGYAWKAPAPNPGAAGGRERAGDDPREKMCPVCRHMNRKNALFCERCGQPFVTPGAQHNPYQNGNPYQGGAPYQGGPGPGAPGGMPFPGPMGMGGMPFMYDPMGGVSPTDAIDDVPAGDIAKLVQTNTQYYLPVFTKIKRGGSSRFNFCAFLFSGGWLLYRKQYKLGILIGGLIALMYLATFCINEWYTYPLMEQMIQQSGITLNTLFMTPEQMNAIANQMAGLSGGELLLFFLPTLLGIARFVIMILCGIKGNRWYLAHCVSKVKAIKADTTEGASYGERLKNEGGCNVPLGLCLIVCYMIASYLPLFL